MGNWHPVSHLSEIPAGTSKEVEFQGRLVALFHLEDRILAIEGTCPHQGAALSEGVVRGCVVTCPWHGWQFDIMRGRNVFNESVVLERYPVRVQDGVVFLAAP